ncbi:pyridoxamine 5'-phosphate oxidase family protein [Actinoplanes sp. NPDC051859]|uniref:pyridoxamine 5'-phosphate oxidase family protein n=1 Tax=Actinoplanes sp. NPDC051859 TaxID=3363909 RepID=UPI0037A2273A
MDLDGYARELLDEHRFVVLGTADESGLPWVSPVFYALDGPDTLYWVSRPEARHSANVAVRPEVSLVVYDSSKAAGEGGAVYMSGHVAVADPAELPTFNSEAVRKGAYEVRLGDHFRLYRATVTDHWVLHPSFERDERVRVHP